MTFEIWFEYVSVRLRFSIDIKIICPCRFSFVRHQLLKTGKFFYFYNKKKTTKKKKKCHVGLKFRSIYNLETETKDPSCMNRTQNAPIIIL